MKMPSWDETYRDLIAGHGDLSDAEKIIAKSAYSSIAANFMAIPGIVEPKYRHEIGGRYTKKFEARVSCSTDPLTEGDTVIVYQDVKGRYHVRGKNEFNGYTPEALKRFDLEAPGNVEQVCPGEPSELSSSEWVQFAGTDAMKWATEFQAIAYKLGYGVLDIGWLLGWMAMAIGAGYDKAQSDRGPVGVVAPVDLPETLPMKINPEELEHFPQTIAGLIDWLAAIARVSNLSMNSCARADSYAQMLDMFKEYSAGPKNFRWVDELCLVKGGDYEYQGTCLLAFPKGVDGPVRYIVMDQNRRLFIHNDEQVKFDGGLGYGATGPISHD